jgi:lipopolysaccharide transport system ATP-binding protein
MAIIEVNHVTKEYRLGQVQSLRRTAQQFWARLRGESVEERPRFKALDDVHFSIEEGEVVGIIGTNGAGKSTLLKLLARISVPTSGRIVVGGRVAPLIEVGAGLVGDLTGRENIYLNSSILGMSRAETTRKLDEMVEFAELEEFIDTPVKRYSSGMYVRLGFAVAVHSNPQILLVDEVLSVGDAFFQEKSLAKMHEFQAQGTTIVVVSHDPGLIRKFCERAVWLDHGHVMAEGLSGDVVDHYLESAHYVANAGV